MKGCRLSTWCATARVWGRALVLFGVLAGAAACPKSEPPPPPTPEPDPFEAREKKPRPTYTQEQFEEILYGMTPAQARDILGTESTDRESTYNKSESEYVAPSVTAWYIWENEDGSYIKLGFVNDKLTEKLSEDLPP